MCISRAIRRPLVVLGAVLLIVALSDSGVSSGDGLDLTIRRGPAVDEVTLEWTGGDPPYQIYRSADPASVTDPANKLGDALIPMWIDSPPLAEILHYRVISLCSGITCATDEICCGGNCVPSDEINCGECGFACSLPSGRCGSTPTCFQGTCIDEGIIVVTELMIDPMNTSDAAGEWVELYNPTSRDIDVRGWVLRDDGLDFHTISTLNPVVVPAGGFSVLVRNNDSASNCGILGEYQYTSLALANSGDEIVIEALDCTIDRFSYSSGFSSSGKAKALDPRFFDSNSNDSIASWCDATLPMVCGDLGTPGIINQACP